MLKMVINDCVCVYQRLEFYTSCTGGRGGYAAAEELSRHHGRL